MKDRYQGMMQTVWSGADDFLDGFYGRKVDDKAGDNTPWNTFRTMYDKINTLETPAAAGSNKKPKKKKG
jgi:hypothetical protein